MELDKLTFGEIKQLQGLLNNQPIQTKHQMLGKRCLIRTYSAGVHIGDVVYVNEMEVKLENALRLWKWEGGGLSLSYKRNRNYPNLKRSGGVLC